MKAIVLTGTVEDQHTLRVDVPPHIPPGRYRVIVLWSEEEYAGGPAQDVAKEWTAEIQAVVRISAPRKTG